MKSLLAILVLLSASIVSASAVEISITKPEKDSSIGCDSKSPEGYCYCPVKGKVSGLKQGQYICTFLQFSGGSVWWVSGNCLTASQVVDEEWEQNYSSCGKDGEKGTIIIKAMVLDKPLESGLNVNELPTNAIAEAGRKVTKK